MLYEVTTLIQAKLCKLISTAILRSCVIFDVQSIQYQEICKHQPDHARNNIYLGFNLKIYQQLQYLVTRL